MVGPCITPSKFKEKQLVVYFSESDDEFSSYLKEILYELEGVYQPTHIQTGIIALVNYSALARVLT